MQENTYISVDKAKIKNAISAEIPLMITTYTFPRETEIYVSELLSCFLKELNQENLAEYLSYCLCELITNAKKANTKRVFFKECGLNLFDEYDYKIGMETFKQDTLNNIQKYLQMQKDEGLFIKLILQFHGGKILIEVRNNVRMTFFEYKRIHDKLARTGQYTSADEAFRHVLDDSEGAGLGLIIMMLMLEKMGFAEDCFQIFSENEETITRIILPVKNDTHTAISTLAKDIAESIDRLPHFPDNIAAINRMLNDSSSTIPEIARQISNDVALTADLLKLVNSAAFSLREPCPDIGKAVQLVGTRGIKNLLYSLGTFRNFGRQSEQTKKLWRHCYRVAFYAHNIAKNLCSSNHTLVQDAYVCGLLHDIGKVLFSDTYSELASYYEKLRRQKNISVQIMEKLFAGANHAEIGARIAEKWHFPDVICAAIRYHHIPDEAPPDFADIAGLVYFANMLAGYQCGEIEFYQFDKGVLSHFGIKTEETLSAVSNKLENAFSQTA
ncbi:MAG: HDOD domain-containing protein [Bacteroides sp.]|nr:HDOD domain-containing protein [Prevotella sp.]MCM1408036.1 HDOD domain-containing protein [Treponema brennaborense]MCM1469012.1 HDOD domain-containing protein [Bacteroides sp.]